jgi:amidase
VAPVGTTAAGLPVGVQLAGPRYEDDTAITFAALLAELTGGYQPPSPLVSPVGTSAFRGERAKPARHP